MDTRDGSIMERQELLEKIGKDNFEKYAKPVIYLSSKDERRLRKNGKIKLGKNRRCPCGSGKMFKNCCKVEDK